MMYQVAVLSFFLSVLLSIQVSSPPFCPFRAKSHSSSAPNQLYLPVDWGRTNQSDSEGFGKRERRNNMQQGSFFTENAKGLGHGGIDVLDPYNHRQLVSLMRERGGVEIQDDEAHYSSDERDRSVEEGGGIVAYGVVNEVYDGLWGMGQHN